MTFQEFQKKLFDRAQAEGFEDYEIYYVEGDSFRVGVFQKEIDSYSVNSTMGLSFRGLYNGKMGYAYSEVLDEDAIELLVRNAKANATAIENEDMEIIYGGKDEYAQINGYNEQLSQVKAEDKIQLALDMERKAFEESDKVKNVQYCVVQSFEGCTRIVNSKGLNLSHRSNGIYAVLVPVVQDGEKVNTASAYKGTKKFEEIDPQALAHEAVEEALAYIGAEPVPSGKYRVVLRNDMAFTLLETFADVFSADRVQKGLSLLKGKIGQVIGAKCLTVLDDPHLKDGMGSIPFDDEGVATYTKEVIKEGKLMTYLHNLKTAMKDGVKSTGNASKASYASPVSIAPSNFYIQPGEKSFQELLEELGDGILITDLQGMHSGANSVSGDFSLAAKGFRVENGKVSRPVEQITIAGNFYKLLEDIEDIGSDLKFDIPTGAGCFGSPSVLIRELSIAGK